MSTADVKGLPLSRRQAAAFTDALSLLRHTNCNGSTFKTVHRRWVMRPASCLAFTCFLMEGEQPLHELKVGSTPSARDIQGLAEARRTIK